AHEGDVPAVGLSNPAGRGELVKAGGREGGGGVAAGPFVGGGPAPGGGGGAAPRGSVRGLPGSRGAPPPPWLRPGPGGGRRAGRSRPAPGGTGKEACAAATTAPDRCAATGSRAGRPGP